MMVRSGHGPAGSKLVHGTTPRHVTGNGSTCFCTGHAHCALCCRCNIDHCDPAAIPRPLVVMQWITQKYNHKGFHKSKILLKFLLPTVWYHRCKYYISKLWQSACCPNVLTEYTDSDCLILIHNYIWNSVQSLLWKPFTFNISSISNILSVSLFLRGVSINPAELKSRSTGAEEGSVVL